MYRHCPLQNNLLFDFVRLNLINHLVGLLCTNLLVIQHLETLYLGENHVRVVCERECEEMLKTVH